MGGGRGEGDEDYQKEGYKSDKEGRRIEGKGESGGEICGYRGKRREWERRGRRTMTKRRKTKRQN